MKAYSFIPLVFFLHGLHRRASAYPTLVSVITSRAVASKHSTEWEIRHRGSKVLDSDNVDLSVVLNNQGDQDELDELEQLGLLTYRVLSKEGENVISARSGINNDLSCYRTVVETYESLDQMANDFPNLVTVETIGESYLKQQGGEEEGYDIKVLVISAGSDVEKSDLMVVGGHHSRELPPPETLMQWGEHLLDSYGKDADITWILQRTRIHIVPIANPDGRQVVQDHLDYMYRKNARPHEHCRASKQGVDLNRNYPMFWGDTSGASDWECDNDYLGGGPLSEPESSAVYEYASSLFDPSIKKGTADEAFDRWEEACPETASGIFIDVHSYGDLIYFPWGYRDQVAPNHLPLLTMSAKLAHAGDYSLWGPEQDGYLYFVSGDATDALYGIDCVFSVGYEIGSEFYASCRELKSSIVPQMKTSLLYAAKCAGDPYLLPLGPDILEINVDAQDPAEVTFEVKVSDGALIVNQANYKKESDKSQPIEQVRVYVDTHPKDDVGSGIRMEAQDGRFDSEDETAILSMDLSGLEGQHTIYFQAQDSDGNLGPVSAAFVDLPVLSATTDAPNTAQPTKTPSSEPASTDAPTTAQPTKMPSVETASTDAPAAGGYFSCFDSMANGVPKGDDCFLVDRAYCYNEVPSQKGCIYTLATYQYYNINPGKADPRHYYGFLSIFASSNCGSDKCFVSGLANKCGGCQVLESHAVELQDCTGFAETNPILHLLEEDSAYPQIETTDAVCAHAAALESSQLTRNGGVGEATKPEGSVVLQLKPKFTLSFIDGHQEHASPGPNEMLILLQRTEAYVRDLLSKEYSSLLESIEVKKVNYSYNLQPKHEFVLSFTARITLTAAAINDVKGQVVTQLLSDRHNLEGYVVGYARFADPDGTNPNGIFFYTKGVRAKVVGAAPKAVASNEFA